MYSQVVDVIVNEKLIHVADDMEKKKLSISFHKIGWKFARLSCSACIFMMFIIVTQNLWLGVPLAMCLIF